MLDIQRDYLEPEPEDPAMEVPKELAVRIVRKAVAMAEKFENQAVNQMVKDARTALRRGETPALIIRQMQL